MLHTQRFNQPTGFLFDKVCQALAISERNIGDIVSTYSLAHGMIAFFGNVDGYSKSVDDLSQEIENVFLKLVRDGRLSTIKKHDRSLIDEAISYYRIEDNSFFFIEARHFIR